MAIRQPIPRLDDLLTIKDACDLLGISRATLYRWIERDYLVLYKIGGSSRIDRGQIERYLVRRAS